MTDPILTVDGVDSGYGEVQVLDDLSLTLGEGEIACLVGPNGAGKSTVFKTMFGMLKPWTGSVRLGDREIGGIAPKISSASASATSRRPRTCSAR